MNNTDKIGKLGFIEKNAYGSCAFALGVVMFMASFYLLFFYSDIIGMDPALVGIAIMIGKIWDAFSDPMMGFISDHTKSKKGRRKLYFLIGSVPLAIAFFIIWSPPAAIIDGGTVPLFIYLTGCWVLLNTGFTVVAVPYYSFGAEITQDPDERSSAFAYNYAYFRIGQLVAVILPNLALESPETFIGILHGKLGLFSDAFADRALVYLSNPTNSIRMVAAFLGLLVAGSVLGTFFGTKERVRHEEESATGNMKETVRLLFSDLFKTLKNRPYLILIIATLVADANGGIVLSMFPYIMKYWMKMEGQMSAFFSIVVVSGIIFAFMWVAVSKRIGKKNVYLVAQALYGIVLWAFLLLGPDSSIYLIVIIMLGMGASLSAYMMVWSLIADVVDYDEHKTGKRHEGAFFGFYTFAQKTAMAFGVLLVGVFLNTIGLEKGAEVTPQMVSYIKMFIGPFAGTINFFGFAVFLMFHYDREEHGRIQTELNERKLVQSE